MHYTVSFFLDITIKLFVNIYDRHQKGLYMNTWR